MDSSLRRVHLPDLLRGAALLLMVLYHAVFDLWLFEFSVVGLSQALLDPFALGWIAVARLALIGFIGVAGMVAVIKREQLEQQGGGFGAMLCSFGRQALVLAGWAILISIVSWLVVPQAPVRFGVLHFLAVSTLLAVPLQRSSRAVLVVVSAVVFGGWVLVEPAAVEWGGWIGLMLGVGDTGAAVDYVPLLPWFGVYVLGMCIGKFFLIHAYLQQWQLESGWQRLLRWLGRRSLAIYMIHQPILLFLGVLLFMFGMLQPISPEVSPAADIPSSLPSPMVTPTPTPSLSVEALPAIPLQYELDAGSHVFQTFNNCGPASLSMALSYFDVDRSQASLGDVLRPYQHSQGNNDDKSVTLDELEAWAEANGYGAVHRPAGDIELLQRFVAAELPVIVRTWLNPDEDIGHYRVVVGYDREREILIQDDSLQGDDLEYSYSDFNEIWEAFFYEYLVLIPAERAGELEPLLGTISTEMNAWQDALEQATAQLDENPNDLWAQFNRSVALYQLGRFQESIAAFEQVEGRLPSRTLWYQIQPLLAYYRAGEYGEVMTRTEAILENENAAFSELFVLRAAVLRQQGADPAARQALERAARYNESSYWLQNIPQSIREDAAVEDVL